MDLLMIVLIGALLLSLVLLLLMKIYYSKLNSQLKNENDLFKIVNEYQAESVVVFSERFEILSANKAARKLLLLQPYKKGEVPPNEIKFKAGRSDIQTLPDMIQLQSKISKGTIHLERVLMTIKGTRHHVNLYIDRSKWNKQNAFVCIFEDISSEFQNSELVKQIGEIDFLTNLPSQFKANEDINKLVISAQREHKKLAFFLFGINNFNKIKFTFGFTYANNVLKKFGEFFKSIESKNIKSYRLDNDNFLYMVEDVKNIKEATEIGETLSKNLSGYFVSKSHDAKLIFSIGAVIFPTHGRNSSKLIDHAFLALEESIQKGDGSLVFFNKKRNNTQEDERTLIEDIKISLVNGDFEVYYQPIMNLETKEINAAEALVRWNHPRLGVLTSEKFIKSAEVSGLIMEIGTFVMEEVISQHKKWHQFGFKDIEISINISARELLAYHLSEKMEQLFTEHGVEAKYFNLDMSERDALEDFYQTDYEFSILKEIGVTLSLDHFGIGGSSIAQLQKLPIHTLKIDQSLIKDIHRDTYHQETVKAIIMLANALKMEVIAGGVETLKQQVVLEKLGCHLVQGHIFYKPAPAFEFQELLRKYTANSG